MFNFLFKLVNYLCMFFVSSIVTFTIFTSLMLVGNGNDYFDNINNLAIFLNQNPISIIIPPCILVVVYLVQKKCKEYFFEKKLKENFILTSEKIGEIKLRYENRNVYLNHFPERNGMAISMYEEGSFLLREDFKRHEMVGFMYGEGSFLFTEYFKIPDKFALSEENKESKMTEFTDITTYKQFFQLGLFYKDFANGTFELWCFKSKERDSHYLVNTKKNMVMKLMVSPDWLIFTDENDEKTLESTPVEHRVEDSLEPNMDYGILNWVERSLSRSNEIEFLNWMLAISVFISPILLYFTLFGNDFRKLLFIPAILGAYLIAILFKFNWSYIKNAIKKVIAARYSE